MQKYFVAVPAVVIARAGDADHAPFNLIPSGAVTKIGAMTSRGQPRKSLRKADDASALSFEDQSFDAVVRQANVFPRKPSRGRLRSCEVAAYSPRLCLNHSSYLTRHSEY